MILLAAFYPNVIVVGRVDMSVQVLRSTVLLRPAQQGGGARCSARSLRRIDEPERSLGTTLHHADRKRRLHHAAGILSHRRVAKLQHKSVAKQEVQDRRAKVHIPRGRALHEYANLYICARNPMLYLRKHQHQSLCVLRVETPILDVAQVVVTDQNAASRYCRFAVPPAGLAIIDRDQVFAEYWTHPGDQIAEWRHKSVKCAEVLVPDSLDPSYILGAYVSNAGSLEALVQQAPGLQVTINPHLFFR